MPGAQLLLHPPASMIFWMRSRVMSSSRSRIFSSSLGSLTSTCGRGERQPEGAVGPLRMGRAGRHSQGVNRLPTTHSMLQQHSVEFPLGRQRLVRTLPCQGGPRAAAASPAVSPPLSSLPSCPPTTLAPHLHAKVHARLLQVHVQARDARPLHALGHALAGGGRVAACGQAGQHSVLIAGLNARCKQSCADTERCSTTVRPYATKHRRNSATANPTKP